MVRDFCRIHWDGKLWLLARGRPIHLSSFRLCYSALSMDSSDTSSGGHFNSSKKTTRRSVMAAPLLMGNDLRNLDPQMKAILLAEEVRRESESEKAMTASPPDTHAHAHEGGERGLSPHCCAKTNLCILERVSTGGPSLWPGALGYNVICRTYKETRRLPRAALSFFLFFFLFSFFFPSHPLHFARMREWTSACPPSLLVPGHRCGPGRAGAAGLPCGEEGRVLRPA